MIRVIELSPAAGDHMAAKMDESGIAYRRIGTRFTLYQTQDHPADMAAVSAVLRWIHGAYGGPHMLRDEYL